MSTTHTISPVGHETIPGPDDQPNVVIPRIVHPEWVQPAPDADGEAYEDLLYSDAWNTVDWDDFQLGEDDWGPF